MISGIYAIHISAIHNIVKNSTLGISRVCNVCPKLGVFLQTYEIQLFCCFITQLIKNLHQWSLYEVLEYAIRFEYKVTFEWYLVAEL